jgi:hypothetical protein
VTVTALLRRRDGSELLQSLNGREGEEPNFVEILDRPPAILFDPSMMFDVPKPTTLKTTVYARVGYDHARRLVLYSEIL